VIARTRFWESVKPGNRRVTSGGPQRATLGIPEPETPSFQTPTILHKYVRLVFQRDVAVYTS